MSKDTTAIVSGGLDSVTLAYDLADLDILHSMISFDYGQRHRARELDCARRAARALGVEHTVVDLSSVGNAIAGGGSSLLGEAEVPDGHYAQESMRATIVPNRNLIMAAVAGGYARSHGVGFIAAAVHGGDHFIYPDCRPEFIAAANTAIMLGTLDEDAKPARSVALIAPFTRMTKADIVAHGAHLGVPFAETWSCYKGGERHCGSCGTCFERREAFTVARIDDPTDYEATPDYDAP